MKIPDRFRRYYFYLEKGRKETLKDEKTKLYVKAAEDIWIVTVDRGIIANANQSIRKCDYLIYGEKKETAHLIELKGSIIDEAYKQLNATIQNIALDKDISYLLEGRKQTDAYIVSPNTQKIPRGNNSHERQLARSLASRCKIKPEDITSLIHYVKVVPKQAKIIKDGQRLISSGQAPVEFE